MTRRLACQQGMTLIEVMVTVLVITVGTLATLGTYVHFSGATNTARERATLISLAQREIEQLKPIAYDQLGMFATHTAQAATEAPLSGRAATEPLVDGGVVRPGGDAFSYRGATGRIYRYVTWRAQTCGNLQVQIEDQLVTLLGAIQADVQASVSDLCPSTSQTKRVTVVVVPTDEDGATARGVTLTTVREDPELVSLSGLDDGLTVDPVTAAEDPVSAAEAISTQALYLTDTRCSETARRTPVDHVTRDTSQEAFTCTASGPAPKLMTPMESLGATTDPVRDFSTDVLRLAPGGLALQRDTRAGACDTPSQNLVYSNLETVVRMKSLVTWASVVPGAVVETPNVGGRASLTLWTSTASGLPGEGRLCVTVRRSITGEVVGSSDFQLSSWPGTLTQLVTAFEIAHTELVPGERLLLTLRVPSDSGNDLRIRYDHAGSPSNLSLTFLTGSEIR
ncbi:MAG: prepilin-type N-terminal cleavage/methylation domain-containing protein [Solirubrobacteraceae bacterium]